jgi:3-oxoacyl-[acyl-carrier protein] reductase
MRAVEDDSHMNNRLEDKVIVIIGADKGLGGVLARVFASEAAIVVVNYSVNRTFAESLVADISSKGGEAVAIRGVTNNATEIEDLFKTVIQLYERLDVLVNNSEIYNPLPAEEKSDISFPAHMEFSTYTYLIAIDKAAKYMVRGGSVLNISSLETFSPPSNSSLLEPVSRTVERLTLALSSELAARSIRVNMIKAKIFFNKEPSELGRHACLSEHIKGRVQLSAERVKSTNYPNDDILSTAVFLVSDESKWINGKLFLSFGSYPG